MKLNFSGRLYEVHAYGVDGETERIDYDALAAQAAEVRPEGGRRRRVRLPADLDFERLATIAHGVGALLFVDMAHVAGSSPPASTRARSRTPTSSRRRPTRRSAGRAGT